MQTVHVGDAVVPSVATLVELLRGRAAQQADHPGYTFLLDGETRAAQLSYAELDCRARAIAATLQARYAPGTRALLLYPPGLDYLAGFFGCLYAGLIAVPAYPPQQSRALPRLQTIVADAAPGCLLTSAAVLDRLAGALAPLPALAALDWLATDQLDLAAAVGWGPPALDGATLAFLQYTSGSTAAPKGVMLTHGNLLHNLALIADAFGHSSASRGVIWLPPYHDMGLIGGILQPLYVGFPVTLLAPTAFLQRPLRWLQAITRERATTSGGPNFAYELCLRSISAEQRAQLDLSSWQVAFTGAEPVRAATLDRFAETFAACGFRRSAFYPCYGLAEATLIVSGGDVTAEPTLHTVQAAALSRGQAIAAPGADPDGRTLVGCGRARPGLQIAIVDPETQAAREPGAVGEVWVGGPSVAQGYWNRPEETARAFTARLDAGAAGPYLRTGDLGFVHGGELFITGRHKDLIIIRGRNHYPQDIELTVAASHPALRPDSGVAFAVETAGEERLVVVHEVERQARHADLQAVLDAIRQQVAEQHELQPAAILLLKPASLPKTSSGKLQRQATRAAFLAGRLEPLAEWRAADDAAPPLDDSAPPLDSAPAIQSWLLAELARMLGQAPDTIDEGLPLVRYGLDSMQAIELHHRLEQRSGVLLPPATLLQDRSIAELAREVQARRVAAPDQPPLAATPGVEAAPLSYGQRALWLVQRLAPESTAYTVAQALEIDTALDHAALHRSLQALVDRHEALRTSFPAIDGVPTARTLEQASVCFELVDASGWDAATLEQRLSEAAAQPFDLDHGPLLRAWLFSRTTRQHVLLLTLHHSITDFWSQALLLHELNLRYAAEQTGAAPALPALPLRYADYARWQQALLDSAEGARLWRYWQQQLGPAGSAAPSFLELPTDYPRPALLTDRGAAHALRLAPALTDALKQLSAAHDATLYMTLLTAFQVLLARWSGQQSLLVGSPVAGRSRAELAPLVGYFVNPLVLRAEIEPGMSFAAALAQTRATVLGALAHQDLPFALLVERLQPRRDPARPPLVQVLFALQQAPPHAPAALAALALGLPGVTVELEALSLRSLALAQQTTQFELTLALAEVDGALAGSIQYNRDLFAPTTIARLGEHFERLLQAALRDPQQPLDALPLLSAAERQRVLHAWNETAVELPAASTLTALFEAQVARTPDAIAVVGGDERLSYRELNRRANQLAHLLIARGVRGYPDGEAFVGVCLDRSPAVLVALLGVLKAGAAYVPLDPAYPAERLALMLRDSQISALISQSALAETLPAHAAPLICLDRDGPSLAAAPTTDPVSAARLPQRLAYAIYTSGSTGVPKAVCCDHRGVINLAQAFARRAPVASGGRWSWWTSLSFDVSVYEIFTALLAGGELHIVPEALRPDGPALVRWLAERQITSCYMPPFALPDLAALLRERAAPLPLKRLLVGAEPLDEALLRELAAALPATRMLNGYGPTETTVSPTLYPIAPGVAQQRHAPIGRPIDNMRAYVLDAQLQPQPIGVVGELYLGGVGLARGYLGRPALTAERFLPDPFAQSAPGLEGGGAGARLYRTGDLARWRDDGNLQFVGRRDEQVKLRGFRVELGEIEAALLRAPGVRAAAAVVREGRLVAYVVGEASAENDGTKEQRNNDSSLAQTAPLQLSSMRQELARLLPAYMIPAAFVELPELPQTPSGKTDRRALALLPPPTAGAAAAAFVAPQSALEQTIAGLWRDALGLERVGIHDHFFELGGHSLLLAQLHGQLQTALGRELPLTALFNYPTVALLARHLSEQPSQPTFQRSIERAAARKAARGRRRPAGGAQQGEDEHDG